MLKYPPFAAVSGIVAAAKGGHPLKQGQQGAAVAMLQGALIELGVKMPKSVGKAGAPDGIFGWETFEALKTLQTKNKLNPDGVAGKDTLAFLDALLVAKTAKTATPPSPLPQPPAPRSDHYMLGTSDPRIAPDAGAGKWNSKRSEATYVALKASVLASLLDASVIIGDDASKHMLHYLSNTGRPYAIDLEGMIEEVPSARENLEIEVEQAQEFADTLPAGKHQITSRNAEGGYNEKEENWNWFYAIGGYSSWGKGALTVTNGAAGKEYVLEFEYRFFDRYNWDKGKSVKIFKIEVTDHFMGEFHRQGLAQEFDCVGSIKRRLSWRQGERIPKAQLSRQAGGR